MEASNQFPRYQVIFSLVRCGFSRKTLSVMITFLPNVLCCLCQGRSSGRYCSFHSYQPCQLSRSGAARRPICCPPHALRTSCTLDCLEYRRISEELVLRYVPAYSPCTGWAVAHWVLMHFCMEVNAPHIRFYSERIQGLGISFCIPDLLMMWDFLGIPRRTRYQNHYPSTCSSINTSFSSKSIICTLYFFFSTSCQFFERLTLTFGS